MVVEKHTAVCTFSCCTCLACRRIVKVKTQLFAFLLVLAFTRLSAFLIFVETIKLSLQSKDFKVIRLANSRCHNPRWELFVTYTLIVCASATGSPVGLRRLISRLE